MCPTMYQNRPSKSHQFLVTKAGVRIIMAAKARTVDKKPSKFQFYFSGVLEAFSMLKKSKTFFC